MEVPPAVKRGHFIFREVRQNIRDIRRAHGRVEAVYLEERDFDAIRDAYLPRPARPEHAMRWTGMGWEIILVRGLGWFGELNGSAPALDAVDSDDLND